MMAFSLNRTKTILSSLGVYPNKKLGQNFLINEKIVELSTSWSNAQKGDFIVEVGPGCGTLTTSLIEAGASVFAIEKDNTFYQHISTSYPINIKHGDALEFPVGNFDLHAPYKIVANLPYAIASVWLDKVLELPRLPECMVLLVQKEAADRWLAPSGTKHFCALGINLQAAYYIENKHPVSKRCFYPQPSVDSVLIHLQKRNDGIIFSTDFKQFIREVFIHRRQQIGRCCRNKDNAISNKFLQYLAQNNIDEKTRAEAIPLNFWINFQQTIWL